MYTSKIWASLAITLCLLFFTISISAQVPDSITNIYTKAIYEAMSPSPAKVCDTLIAINSLNKNLERKTVKGVEYILMVAWKDDTVRYEPDSGRVYNTQKWPVWVTPAPQLLQRMSHTKPKDVNLRLEQLIGLPPNSGYKYFIEFWVQPRDLYRPCLDSQIADSTCGLWFPKYTDPDYINWVNELRANSYSNCELLKQYPWTQLGYTFDWSSANKSNVGLSEFIISKYSNVIINKFYTTEEYLNQ